MFEGVVNGVVNGCLRGALGSFPGAGGCGLAVGAAGRHPHQLHHPLHTDPIRTIGHLATLRPRRPAAHSPNRPCRRKGPLATQHRCSSFSGHHSFRGSRTPQRNLDGHHQTRARALHSSSLGARQPILDSEHSRPQLPPHTHGRPPPHRSSSSHASHTPAISTRPPPTPTRVRTCPIHVDTPTCIGRTNQH